jgi:poly-gamma-glutamate synthesis protein (capsule biosynthesis protein)
VTRLRVAVVVAASALLLGATPSAAATSSTCSGAVAAGASWPASGAAVAADVVTLGFGGDVHFEGALRAALVRPVRRLAPLRPWVGRPDVTMVNLETAITGRGVEQPKKWHFRTSPRALVALRAAGVDVVTMANNHAVDYGPLGLTDTLAARGASPIPVVGIGRNARDAFAPYVVDVRGTRIAFFGATDLADLTSSRYPATASSPGVASIVSSRARLLRGIRAWRGRVDTVVVYLHGGVERVTCPTGRQVDTARALARAGASVVVTAHAHVLLGAGWRGRTFVSHGLGNFLWYSANSVRESQSGLLTVTLQDGVPVASRLVPSYHGTDGLPRRARGARADRIQADLRSLTRCTGLARSPRSR